MTGSDDTETGDYWRFGVDVGVGPPGSYPSSRLTLLTPVSYYSVPSVLGRSENLWFRRTLSVDIPGGTGWRCVLCLRVFFGPERVHMTFRYRPGSVFGPRDSRSRLEQGVYEKGQLNCSSHDQLVFEVWSDIRYGRRRVPRGRPSPTLDIYHQSP